MFVFFPNTVLSASGCCSHHGGVDCSRVQTNGRVVCNDGWLGSSCSYSSMQKCKSNSNSYYSTSTSNNNYYLEEDDYEEETDDTNVTYYEDYEDESQKESDSSFLGLLFLGWIGYCIFGKN